MEPLIFSLNAVLPLVLMTILGYAMRRMGFVTAAWASTMNKACFRVLLPVLLFMNIYSAERLEDINWSLTLFAAVGILAAFAAGWLVSWLFIPERRRKGVVWQCVFRSNFAFLGTPLAIALFGNAGGQSAAVLSLFSIPMFNVLAVIALQLYGGDTRKNGAGVTQALKEVAKNPLIISVFIGFVALAVRSLLERYAIAFRLTDVKFLYQALSGISQAASPMAIMALGAQFDFRAAKGLARPLALGIGMRNAAVPTAVLVTAYCFFPGIRGADFAALLALFGSPVAVSSVVMAAEMGGDESLAGQLVFWTTLLSAGTIFIFVLIFRALGALS